MASCPIIYLQLTPDENKQIDALLSEILEEVDTIDTLPFLNTAFVFAHELPRRIRLTLYEFKLRQSWGTICIRGNKVDNALIGPTPFCHRQPGEPERANRYEILHILYATLLGEPFGWTTIQNGYIINDVIPVFEHRDLLTSSGSASTFDLHTEDAFHPYAGDYLGLMCLRSPDKVSTILSHISCNNLDKDVISTLFEPRYIVGANIAQKVPTITEPSPILFGNRNFPYIRVNLNNTRAAEGDYKAANALERLINTLRQNSIKVAFQTGDCWYIDNLRIVHGREPYTPRFNGTDRWLKRLYITRACRITPFG